MSLAIGAIGLGISAKANASSSRKDELDTVFFEGELSSLARANGWLNTPKLRVPDFTGKVVLINFWTYTCINWLRSLPYVREWSKKYKDKGLIVIGVHTPEFGFEHKLSNLSKATANLEVDYPVAIDNDRSIWETFNNNYWPALYILDAKGKIRHHQFGEGGYEEFEQVIQQLLSEAGVSNINHALADVQANGVEAPADWTNLLSPENYLGHVRTQNFSAPAGAAFNKSKKYSIPTQLKLNQWALSGDWTIKDENIFSQKAGGRIACQFHARDLHLVMGSSMNDQSIRFKILIDGEAPGNAHGMDGDENGNGIITEQRLYQLIRQDKMIADRRFEIEFIDSGVEAFAFTFG